jgi:hypothetical protein
VLRKILPFVLATISPFTEGDPCAKRTRRGYRVLFCRRVPIAGWANALFGDTKPATEKTIAPTHLRNIPVDRFMSLPYSVSEKPTVRPF